jgi:hypothetical protein
MGPPELLTQQDFISPLLYKVYKYLRIIYRNGVSMFPLYHYFDKTELYLLVDTLRKTEQDFNEKFNDGYCENIGLRNCANLINRTYRTFEPSTTRKALNYLELCFKSSNKATIGELIILEYIFYHYSEEVFYPKSDCEVGFYDVYDLTRSFKKKEYQLEYMNQLFNNLGNNINRNYTIMVQEVLDTHLKRTTYDKKVVYESIPHQCIIQYLH